VSRPELGGQQTDQLASVAQRAGGAVVDGLLASMVVVVPLLLGLSWAVPGLVGRLPYVGLWVSLAVMASLVRNPRRRGLHDRMAGTIVARVPR
jgi:uncharacterized RDD family membrane protein YckC